MLHVTSTGSEYPYSELDSDTDSDKPLLYDTPHTVRFCEPQTKRRMGFRKWFSRSNNEKRPLIDRITTPMDEILTDEPPTTTDALTSPPRGRKYRDQQREEYERRLHYERTRERERENQREREVDRYSVPRRQIQDSARWHEHVRQQHPPQQHHMHQAHQIPPHAQQQIPPHVQQQIPHQIPPGLNQHMHQAYLNPRQISQIPRATSGYHNQSLLRPMSQAFDPRYFRMEAYPVPPVTYAQVPQSMQAEIVELKDDSGDDKSAEKKEEKSKKQDSPKKEEKKKKEVEDPQSQSSIEKVVKKALQNHRPAVYETLVRMNSFVLSLKLALCIACVAFYPLVGILLIVVLFGSEILLELALKCGPDRS
ncbi:hypothetical protein CJU89_5455 [Yarrowia sp. B02]|nr:hypothetical protein CJU89_5455 [Yarrowia sp. B02]